MVGHQTARSSPLPPPFAESIHRNCRLNPPPVATSARLSVYLLPVRGAAGDRSRDVPCPLPRPVDVRGPAGAAGPFNQAAGRPPAANCSPISRFGSPAVGSGWPPGRLGVAGPALAGRMHVLQIDRRCGRAPPPPAMRCHCRQEQLWQVANAGWPCLVARCDAG